MLLMLKKNTRGYNVCMRYTTRLYRKVTTGSIQRKPVYNNTGSGPNLKSNLTATYTVTFHRHSSLGNFLILKKT
jgi:hypothetical protein